MFNWLLKRIKQAFWFTSSKHNRNVHNTIEKTTQLKLLKERRVQALENFIEQNDDFSKEAHSSHPSRFSWNKTAYYLAEYYRDRLELTKAAHFYRKIKADSPFAPRAYYHLGNIYQYSFNNLKAGAYYFRLAKEKGDAQSSILEDVANEKIVSELLKDFNKSLPASLVETKDLNKLPPIDNLVEIAKKQNEIYSQGVKKMDSKSEVLVGSSSHPNSKEINDPKANQQIHGQKNKQIPRHLLEYFTKPVKNKSHYESPFLKRLAELVTSYREGLENDKPIVFVKAWETRFEDIRALEKTIHDARTTEDDSSLFELCVRIANQGNIYPFGFFSRNEFPKSIGDLLNDVIEGKTEIQLHGLISETELGKKYEEMKQEVEATNRQLYLLQLKNQQEHSNTRIKANIEESQKYAEIENQNTSLVDENKKLMIKNLLLERINNTLKETLRKADISVQIQELGKELLDVKKECDQYKTKLDAAQQELLKMKILLQQKSEEAEKNKNDLLLQQLIFDRVQENNKHQISEQNQVMNYITTASSCIQRTAGERYIKIKHLEEENGKLKEQLADLMAQKESTTPKYTDGKSLQQKDEEISRLKLLQQKNENEIASLRKILSQLSNENAEPHRAYSPGMF